MERRWANRGNRCDCSHYMYLVYLLYEMGLRHGNEGFAENVGFDGREQGSIYLYLARVTQILYIQAKSFLKDLDISCPHITS